MSTATIAVPSAVDTKLSDAIIERIDGGASAKKNSNAVTDANTSEVPTHRNCGICQKIESSVTKMSDSAELHFDFTLSDTVSDLRTVSRMPAQSIAAAAK